jgi:hypothetical protein
MKNAVIASPCFFVITTTIVYALLYPIFLEMDNNALGEGINFVVDENDNTMTYSQQQQQVETECKSPCPPNSEMCITMCAQTDKE